jgi:HK97 family phage major capsid protein
MQASHTLPLSVFRRAIRTRASKANKTEVAYDFIAGFASSRLIAPPARKERTMETEQYTEAVEAITELGDSVRNFKQSSDEHAEQLRDRIEQLEALEAAGGAIGAARREKPYREIFTGEGHKAFEVSAKQRFSDVPELAGKSEVSLERVLGALALGSSSGDREAIEFVNEMKSTTTSTTGITLQNTIATEWIDMVRSQAVLFQAGARSISMPTQSMSFIHQTSDPTASWRSSEGAALSATDPSFAARQLTAITLAVRSQLTLEASQDISDAGRQIAQVHARAMATAIDGAGFTGSAPAPVGIQNTTGRGTVTAVGLVTNYDEVLDGVQAFLNANNALSDLSAIVYHPDIWRIFSGLKTGISGDQTSLEPPPDIADVPRLVSTGSDVVASPEDYHVTLGNFDDLLVAFRMNPTVRILDATTSMASNLLIEIVGAARVDLVALRPASFVTLEGLTTS